MGNKKSSKKKGKNRTAKSIRNSKDLALALRDPDKVSSEADLSLHIYGEHNNVCLTNSRGYPTPGNRSRLELLFDATKGFIPVWGPDVMLHWRFNEDSMRHFQKPDAAKHAIRALFGEAVNLWGDAAPIKFTEQADNWDFELVMQPNDRCTLSGCTLARAFFPDSGRHDIAIYPRLFTQTRAEQIETLIHELGHVFGLRHFFANVSETDWPSVKFGSQNPFTIMNYGSKSQLTDADRADLRLFYSKVWSGELGNINGTPIVEFRPFHESVSTGITLQPARRLAASCQCPSCGTPYRLESVNV